jgi:YebC/PmpR family DNA-binding regulatory protein
MAGHSKWAKVKHFKGGIDAKRSKLFGKLSKEIMVACRHGGGDPGFNPRLRTILLKARFGNMPADNIERAIKKGTGELGDVTFEELVYEAYAPGGVALIIDLLTDNKNRTAAEIRVILTRHGGNLSPCKHLFHRKGQIIVPKEQIAEDDLMALVLDAGAEDMVTHDDSYEVLTDPHQFEPVHKAIEAKSLKPVSAEVAWLPLNPVPVTEVAAAKALLNLIEALEDHDDVQNVHSSADIPDDVAEKAHTAA